MDEAERCYYCGDVAGSIDHVVPQSMLEILKWSTDKELSNNLNHRHRIKTVPACRECNCLLSNIYFKSLQERKNYLKRRLRQRYKRILAMPVWTDSDFGGMSNNLRNYILKELVKKERIEQRIKY